MKLIFKQHNARRPKWFERNTETPFNDSYFDVRDLRAWFLKWVFK